MDEARQSACDPPRLGAAMPPGLDGYRWARDAVGESGSAIWCLHGREGAPDLYLKHGRGRVASDIADEAARLVWLGAHLPVPDLVHFVRTPDEASLLTAAIAGPTAWQVLDTAAVAPGLVVDALARFMRRLHAIPVAECPFDASHPVRLRMARARIDDGLVDVDDFDAQREGWTAEQVWTAMHALPPLRTTRVVTHGDFSLDNLVMRGAEVVGCIDLGRVGVADPYQDLAILWNCLGEFDPALQRRLFDSYGIPAPDADRLAFHLMLDELF